MKYNTIIAIDPDTDKSGVAILTTRDRQMILSSWTFPEVVEFFQSLKRQKEEDDNSFIVVVEAGWLITTNWHLGKKDNLRTASAKGNAAGRNHETGRKLVEMCKHWNINVLEHLPLRKCWSGPDRKITHEELSQFVNIPKRTNQEERDAALLAWNYANFPIVVKWNKSSAKVPSVKVRE